MRLEINRVRYAQVVSSEGFADLANPLPEVLLLVELYVSCVGATPFSVRGVSITVAGSSGTYKVTAATVPRDISRESVALHGVVVSARRDREVLSDFMLDRINSCTGGHKNGLGRLAYLRLS